MICEKVKYNSKAEALDAVKGIAKDKRPSQSKKKAVAAYQCTDPDCRAWHVTSNKHRHHSPRSITKELRTSEQKQIRPLKIIDLTRGGLQSSI